MANIKKESLSDQVYHETNF